jgi:diguanylate cyclase (GGDEF)-like protein/PAS domain S-box-containing protein
MSLKAVEQAHARATALRSEDRSSSFGLEGLLLRTAFDGAPVGVGVCDEDGRFLEVNESLCMLLRQSRQNVLGRPFLTFVHPEQRSASMASYFRAVVAAAANQISTEHSELLCLTGTGATIWVAVTWTITEPDEDGCQYGIVHLRDVTEQKRTQRRLAKIQRRMELAFRCAPIGVAVVNPDGRLIESNPALQTMLGHSAAALGRLTFEDISHPEDRDGVRPLFEALLAGELESHDTVRRYLRSDGSVMFARRVLAMGDDTEGRGQYILLQMEDVTGERLARAELRERQLRDSLTGLATRESLAYELTISTMPRSLVVVELRDLSRLNGVLGPSYGDQVLVQAAERLRLCSRETDLVARLGGNEFAILLDDVDGSAAELVAQRAAVELAEPMIIDQTSVRVSASIGSTTDPAGAEQLEALLQRADLALHINKGAGDHSWTSFEPTMLDSTARELVLESDLRLALDNGDVAVVYQPIYNLESGALRSVETLSRWTHDSLGVIEPTEFTGLADRAGLMDKLVEHTLRRACDDLNTWRRDAGDAANGLTVAVNVSPQCLAGADFPAMVANCLIEADVPAELLVLEITESALSQSDPAALANAQTLRGLGIRLSMDDFGAGHSSLARLTQLPITDIKLDRSFIQDIDSPGTEAPIIRAIIAMAGELGLNVVGEGVETDVQLELLRRYRCAEAQGYLLGRPQSAAEIGRLLSEPPMATVA